MTAVQLYFLERCCAGTGAEQRAGSPQRLSVAGHFQAPAWGGWQIHVDA